MPLNATLKGLLAPSQQLGGGRIIKATLLSLLNGRPNDVTRRGLVRYWQGLGGREAIVTEAGTVSFAQFTDNVLRLAQLLYQQGFRQGDRIALLCGNNAYWFEAMAATSLLGLKMPLINWHLNDAETDACIALSGAKGLISTLEFTHKVSAKTLESLHKAWIFDGESDAYENLTVQRQQYPAELPKGHFTLSPTLFSGGTTGTPKFIQMESQTLRDRRRSGDAPAITVMAKLATKLASFPHYVQLDTIRDPVSHNLRSLVCSPLYHAGGQAAAMPLFLGATIVPMPRFCPQQFLALIEQQRINWTFVAPTMLERVLALPEDIKRRYDLSSMRTLLCSAAPCPASVKIGINQLFRQQGNAGDVFHEIYGSSESGPVTLLCPVDYRDHPHRYDSVGKARGGDCRIYDAETASWAPPGQPGKVLLRSPSVYALAYGGKSESQMRDHFVRVNNSPWYDDGLTGLMDKDGYLYITGRDKEMLIVGGVNIYPNEIEFALKKHPAIDDVAVIGLAHDDLGEVPVAVCSVLQPHATPDEETIIAFAQQEGLYGFKLPRRVFFKEQLPRDAAGKLRKAQLADEMFHLYPL